MEKIKIAVDTIRNTYIALAKGDIKYRVLEKATDAMLASFEKKLGETLPEDFKLFLKLNDVAMSFDGGYYCLSLGEIVSIWNMMLEHVEEGTFDDGRVERHIKEDFGNWDGNYLKKVWWSTKWIPFAEDGCGNTKCIDLGPGKNGKKGQIMSMEIQDAQGPFIDPDHHHSFSDYLHTQLGHYTSKRYNLGESWDGSARIDIDAYL